MTSNWGAFRFAVSWLARYLDNEDATLAGDVPDVELSSVSFDCPTCDRQAQSEAFAPGGSSHERTEQLIDLLLW